MLSDKKNCGGCGMNCVNRAHATVDCVNANCKLAKCDQGWSDCDGKPENGCEVATGNDINNCGRCGNACGNKQVCVNSACTCMGCNIPNAKTRCQDLNCVFDSCLPGYTDCNFDLKDGCEIQVDVDKNNCGACGNVCPKNLPGCADGKCVPGFDFGPVHTFEGLTSTHYITQGGCSAGGGKLDIDANYFCEHFYGTPMGLKCTPVIGYVAGRTPACNDAKMHKRNGCTGNGLDIKGTVCDGGACKIGNWNECTSGITNLICHCE